MRIRVKDCYHEKVWFSDTPLMVSREFTLSWAEGNHRQPFDTAQENLRTSGIYGLR